jgi:hypothetical protein
VNSAKKRAAKNMPFAACQAKQFRRQQRPEIIYPPLNQSLFCYIEAIGESIFSSGDVLKGREVVHGSRRLSHVFMVRVESLLADVTRQERSPN